MAKIGILGGTFDPIHNGHLRLGREAYEEFGLDEVWFMPSGNPPHKKDHKITEGELRERMVKLAIADTPYFRYSDFELKREGNTYTAQTLELLRESRRDDTFYFIIGADSLYQIEQWFHPDQVMKLSVLLVAGRAYHNVHQPLEQQIAYLTARYGARIYPLHCREMDISSEEIRAAAAGGQQIGGYVPEKVEQYILDHGLYGYGAVKQGAGCSVPGCADGGKQFSADKGE